MRRAIEGPEDSGTLWALGLIPVPEGGALTLMAAKEFLSTTAGAYARAIAIAMTSVDEPEDRAAYGMLALDLASRIDACALVLTTGKRVTLDQSALDDVGELCCQLARICASRPAEAVPGCDDIYAACARQIVTLLSASRGSRAAA